MQCYVKGDSTTNHEYNELAPKRFSAKTYQLQNVRAKTKNNLNYFLSCKFNGNSQPHRGFEGDQTKKIYFFQILATPHTGAESG